MTHAALQADYRIIKPVAGRSCYILQLEVPWEAFDEVNRVLGAPPKPGENRWVGVALLNPDCLVTPAPAVASAAEGEKLSKSKGEYGDYAAKLYKSYFMRNEKVCAALGTTEQFKAWIQKQESCISGKQDYIGMDSGEMRCEESHVERVAAGHGKGIKAPYHSVPLTHEEHKLRHGVNGGELACLQKFMPAARYDDVEEAKQWFGKKAIEYREKWVHERLLAELGYQHLNECPPVAIRAFAEEHDLTALLPQESV